MDLEINLNLKSCLIELSQNCRSYSDRNIQISFSLAIYRIFPLSLKLDIFSLPFRKFISWSYFARISCYFILQNSDYSQNHKIAVLFFSILKFNYYEYCFFVVQHRLKIITNSHELSEKRSRISLKLSSF